MAAFSRYTPLATALVLLAMSVPAAAQVTINMTTAQGAGCTATTDANGLVLTPGGTDLAATGVNLSGTGCGAVAADFEATLTIPTGGQAGNPVNVNWSAGADATQCTYGGSTGLTGWPIGTSACIGAACAQPHVVPVTPPAAGTYNLSITCTNASGFRQGSLTATALPDAPQPPNFALTAPATATVGTPFNVSWSVTGATSCTGAASLPSGSVDLTGWTTRTDTTSPRSVTASVAGTYTLRLTCSNANGSTQSQNKVVTVSGGGDPSCPAGRLTIGSIGYPPLGNNPVLRQNVDLTDWDNIWGHTTPTDPVVPWPGIAGTSPVIMAMGRTQYIAAKFHVPAGTPSTWTGFYKNVSNYGGLNITTSISEVCGDFAPAQAGCLKENIPPSDSTTLYWRMQNPTNFHCALEAGRDYYLNIKNTDPAQANGNCPAGNPTCKVHILNNATTN